MQACKVFASDGDNWRCCLSFMFQWAQGRSADEESKQATDQKRLGRNSSDLTNYRDQNHEAMKGFSTDSASFDSQSVRKCL